MYHAREGRQIMPSERVQRHIDRLLDEADEAVAAQDWGAVLARARHILTLDPENGDALAFQAAAERGLTGGAVGKRQRAVRDGSGTPPGPRPPQADSPTPEDASHSPTQSSGPIPQSFAAGCYVVRKFLGEGGKKQVYLAHDMLLDRDIAFALIKTEGLDAIGRDRIKREAQAMGRLGAHPHIVSVFDLGEEAVGSRQSGTGSRTLSTS